MLCVFEAVGLAAEAVLGGHFADSTLRWIEARCCRLRVKKAAAQRFLMLSSPPTTTREGEVSDSADLAVTVAKLDLLQVFRVT